MKRGWYSNNVQMHFHSLSGRLSSLVVNLRHFFAKCPLILESPLFLIIDKMQILARIEYKSISQGVTIIKIILFFVGINIAKSYHIHRNLTLSIALSVRFLAAAFKKGISIWQYLPFCIVVKCLKEMSHEDLNSYLLFPSVFIAVQPCTQTII